MERATKKRAASKKQAAKKNQSGPVTIALIKADNKYYILMDRETKRIVGYNDVAQGLASFEYTYNRNHRRSYEGSMSACINYIFYQPAIVSFKDVEELKRKLVDGEPELFELSHVSGFMSGVLANAKGVAKIWQKAKKPALITEEGAAPQ